MAGWLAWCQAGLGEVAWYGRSGKGRVGGLDPACGEVAWHQAGPTGT